MIATAGQSESADLTGIPPPSAFKRKWTYAEACAELPETNVPIEIWDGQLVMSPTPFFHHQDVVFRMSMALDSWVRPRQLGKVIVSPMDVVFEKDLVLQPDIVFIVSHRTAIIQRHIIGAPDLVVEVVSPGRRKRDYKDKRDRYEEQGVKEYWILDPEQKHIEIWFLNGNVLELLGRFGGRRFASSKLLPGFKVRADQMLVDSLKL